MEEQRNAFVNEVKKPIDIEAGGRNLAQLENLPNMKVSMDDIKHSVAELSDAVGRIDGYVGRIAGRRIWPFVGKRRRNENK